MTPRTLTHQSPLSMEFSRQEYGVGCHSLLQGIFPAQISNLSLLHCRQILCSPPIMCGRQIHRPRQLLFFRGGRGAPFRASCCPRNSRLDSPVPSCSEHGADANRVHSVGVHSRTALFLQGRSSGAMKPSPTPAPTWRIFSTGFGMTR